MNINQDFSSLQDPIEIVNSLLEILSEKEKTIIIHRFGLAGNKVQTLAAIGDKFSVTRERVRQVQNYTIKKLQRNARNTNLSKLHEVLNTFIDDRGGIISESELEDFLIDKYPEHSANLAELKLAAVLSEQVIQEYNRVDYLPHYRRQDISFSLIKDINLNSLKLLKKKSQATSTLGLAQEVQKTLASDYNALTLDTIYAAWDIDRRIVVKGESISIKAWRHVNPRTLNDKINFIFNEEQEAMHYSEITEKIQAKNFDDKPISTQAIHNELINSEAFVLIGRGIYALKKWGYKEGTVADVLESILEKNGPMHLEDLTKAVLQRRKVKEITVQINLNSKKHKFQKNKAGQYELV